MRTQCLAGFALAAILAGGAPAMAQVVSVPPVTTVPPAVVVVQQSFTTGMVGLTLNQTARLNVLNLNIVPAANTTAPVNCNVQMQFFDGKNSLLGQTVVTNFAPETATDFDLKGTAVTSSTASRNEIRGVVTVNPALPTASAVNPGYCGVMITLEIFDNTTGSTVALTSDTRATGLGVAVPLPVVGTALR
jgi:hypothetical protein